MVKRNPYTPQFFAHIRDGSLASAVKLVPIVLDIAPARSMVDVGCGIGAWVKTFREQGAADAVGIDGFYVEREQLLIDSDRFVAHDLNQPLDTALLRERFAATESGRFDLAISLEVAEHLAVKRAHSLVRDLCDLADVVLFAAAIPFQGGADHVNEQWQSYWAKLFADNGYDAFDVLRPMIWPLRDVAFWYKQNAIFYVKRGSPAHDRFVARFGAPTDAMFDIVHPELFRGKVNKLKNGNILQKMYNRFRLSGDEPRTKVLETGLWGDEHWQPRN